MRTFLSALTLSLLSLSLPFSALATETEEELTPEQTQRQMWDTECRAALPYGQGDLEAALLYRLRQCVNRKQNAWTIEQKLAKERERLSNREEREKARRQTVLTRLRTGAQHRIENALPRRAEQGTLLLRYRSRRRYQQVHESIRQPGSTNATTEE
ncbi:MAG TPA: hypothetical protein DEB30_05800 [Candidatus Peribacter riflensis]|uniref:Uncharacterized protein n=1 Tax=Candidatus Peribacter riflensis TaxID=1735162 RepID=A0A0S1SHQ4_9BACT|nr:MAG: hypothetical protein PeribacterA2_0387 [Candidatus Peribacter riflensis]OGJ78783.1 MAG: hypothetical protein A2398_00585 [Candidatus Peribacteria bacterium RIFOXYB1_FULL_57_12]ALM10877.1 MAG: hypothetical protein PeribacterB2_0387 [Candidatus Peribacter riflensis]ALM11979.1 MAG: hypothetical protein PeribacterC2_0386 [Candidatus Peribacter riflensis]ALM13082.1 MAG: hypothetical protein PeribacterD1_0387 [Candidatus Peribacter riflensis]